MNIEETAKHLGLNIMALRKMRGLTQAKLSQVAGIPRSTITNFETGLGNPSLANLVKLAKALEVPVDELLAPPSTNAKLIKKTEFNFKNKNNCLVYDLLPWPVKGLHLEKMEMDPNAGFIGIPHLKGTKEYFTCIQGKVIVTVSGTSHTVEKGDLLIFSGDEKHSYKNAQPSKSLGLSIIIQDH